MLSNLETEKSKLIQIIMVGQPELRQKLALRQLEQLRQRITVSYHLLPLDADDTANYINHRLKRAAIGTPPEFPRPVTDRIHARSRGVPRIINVIADATLLFAYGLDRRHIDLGIVEEALAELDTTGVLASYQEESAHAGDAVAMSVAEAEEALRIGNEVRRRERLLDNREQQIRERERALAIQQRVLEEEARLLAAARSARTAAARPQPTTAEAPSARTAPPAAPLVMATSGPSIGGPIPPAAGTTLPNGTARAVQPPRAHDPAERYRAQGRVPAPPVGVRGRYEQSSPIRPSGFWAQVRRVLFGVEAERGA